MLVFKSRSVQWNCRFMPRSTLQIRMLSSRITLKPMQSSAILEQNLTLLRFVVLNIPVYVHITSVPLAFCRVLRKQETVMDSEPCYVNRDRHHLFLVLGTWGFSLMNVFACCVGYHYLMGELFYSSSVSFLFRNVFILLP